MTRPAADRPDADGGVRSAPPVERLLRLDGRVALVTGAGAGIGSAVARRFAEAGARVAVHYRSSAEGAERLVDEILRGGGNAAAVRGDVTASDEVDRVVAEVEGALGPLDILVNNAGIYPIASLLEMSDEAWDETLDANLRSVFLCTRAAARSMRDRGGAIVNIGSIEGERAAPGHSHYNASKAAVRMHTLAVAAELGPLGIRVNCVSPGLIGRPGLEDAWPEGVERWLDRCPLGRVGTPEDVADACLFLASDAARWITGANLVVDGGTLGSPAF